MKIYIKLVGVIVLLFTLLGLLLSPVLLTSKVFAKGTASNVTISGIDVGSLAEEKIEPTLQKAVDEWKEQPLTIQDEDVTLTIHASNLSFNVAAVVSQYKTVTAKPWYAFWQKPKEVELTIPVTLSEAALKKIAGVSSWNQEAIVSQALAQAGGLLDHSVNAIVLERNMIENERLAFQLAEIPIEAKGTELIVSLMKEHILLSQEPYSLLQVIGEQSASANEIAINFIASTLYSAVLQTDIELLERHVHEKLPHYLQQGLDAKVNGAVNKDLRFVNTSNQAKKLKIAIEGQTLKVEIFAPTKEKEIMLHISQDNIVKPRIIYRYSDDLVAGQQRVDQEGQEGIRVEVYRSIVEDGSTNEQLISKDYYAPLNRIVTRSSKEPKMITTTTQITGKDTVDADLQIDLDDNGLADVEEPVIPNSQEAGPEIVYGYYDKGGNFVQTSP
ncbi:VanW family protein [Lysinibacillus sp. NPDC097195]|uniref:VanW family protein n=1 Tax=Lysinibacillus sp. NPDC097195 TaxID=3364141 RepID=UPI00380805B1